MVKQAQNRPRISMRPSTGEALRVGPSLLAVVLMLVWAAHDGGYDADTWYWGALVLLALVAVLVVAAQPRTRLRSGPLRIALAAFGAYVAWSYLSIAWAASPGDALTGSNRALLYLLVFAVFACTSWRPRDALALLMVWALGMAVIAVFVLVGMTEAGHAASLFSEGRLVSPTGYFNSTAALFTAGAFVAVALAVRRELPVLVRGALVAGACAELQLALLAESRGWLFTLPLMLIVAVAVTRDRLRVAAFAVLPALATLVPLQRLLDVFRAAEAAHPTQGALVRAAQHAGRAGLLACAIAFVVGTLLAVADWRARGVRISPAVMRLLGAAAATVALALAIAGGVAATHGHPVRFLNRQWHGFTHPAAAQSSSSTSYFAVAGTGRYDIWRVAIDAALAHPLGGLGQDNFADYYVRHRRTDEEPSWTHSLELRVLTHTGFVGLALFTAFLAAALIAALRTRRRAAGLASAVAGAALLPLVVWLIHGSIDWFWEIPALSGPALGFLAMAGALGWSRPRRANDGKPEHARQRSAPRPAVPPRALRGGGVLLATVALLAAVLALGFPYLSVREVSTASNVSAKNPSAALHDLKLAAKLNPLSADADRLAGAIALRNGLYDEAQRRFSQAIAREPGGWYAWLGEGLAASALGDSARAHRAFEHAGRIDDRQPAVEVALARVNTTHPLTPAEAFRLLVLAK
jgi:O-Antigen ligase